ncbi:UNVERIFIED_CONTAM: hypothetical protein FKN15_065897 [Acipenser sinensis]
MRPIAWTSPSPGYSFADRGRELPGGGTQLAKRRPGGGRVRSARVSSAHRALATPVVWLGACGLACKLPRAALSSDAVALGGCMVSLQCVKKRAANGTRFGEQHVFVFALPSQRRDRSVILADRSAEESQGWGGEGRAGREVRGQRESREEVREEKRVEVAESTESCEKESIGGRIVMMNALFKFIPDVLRRI